ncbi:MAG: HAD family phosphatase [Deltaproteobacteria bacterium]|nr:HAD family phosphatase [Deltaproteobacteria bacterium]
MDVIVFDLGGVLIDWNPEYLYRQIFADRSEMRMFLNEICTQEWNEEQDAGRSAMEATEELVACHPHYEDAIRAYYGRFGEMIAGAMDDSVVLLERLHVQGRHRLLALTNWPAETFPLAEARFDFLKRFEGVFVSGREGVKKPDREIFTRFMERYQVAPARCLFIDDNSDNVEAAKAVGMQALQFVDSLDLEKNLFKMSLLNDVKSVTTQREI